MSGNEFVSAFAPASIGNVGVGFDMLGLAIEGAGDTVSIRRSETGGIRIIEVQDPSGNPHPTLSSKGDENTASIAAASVWEAHGDGSGLEMIVRKGIPLQSGMGSSAASAVAAAVAANGLLETPLPLADLLPHALAGEKFASGGLHADNVAPSLVGGLVLCPYVLLPEMICLPVPEGLVSVLVHPDLAVNTAESRSGLADSISIDQWLRQQGFLSAFVSACYDNDAARFTQCLVDEIIEPQRSAAVSCFDAVKAAAVAAGAPACSLSGSGPSIFAICAKDAATTVAEAMSGACRDAGIDCETFISPLDPPGARVVATP